MELKSMMIDGKKFMWDGINYENEAEAKNKEKSYIEEGFETRLIPEAGKFNVYTRRLVTEVVVDGEAPL